MATITNPSIDLTTTAAGSNGQQAQLLPAPTRRSQRWALWGAAAGVLGFAGLTADGSMSLEEQDYLRGADVIDHVSRGAYHAGIVLGMLAVFALLVVASGWRRFAAERAPDSLAARLVPNAMLASAGAMILGYAFKGSLAVYLPGGIDEGAMTKEGLYSVFMFLDFAPFIAWWGVLFAAAGTVWLSLKEKVLPRWLGIVSTLFVALVSLVVLATGLPGAPGVVTPLWLVISSIGVAASRKLR